MRRTDAQGLPARASLRPMFCAHCQSGVMVFQRGTFIWPRDIRLKPVTFRPVAEHFGTELSLPVLRPSRPVIKQPTIYMQDEGTKNYATYAAGGFFWGEGLFGGAVYV